MEVIPVAEELVVESEDVITKNRITKGELYEEKEQSNFFDSGIISVLFIYGNTRKRS